jgi:hypothetical protein
MISPSLISRFPTENIVAECNPSPKFLLRYRDTVHFISAFNGQRRLRETPTTIRYLVFSGQNQAAAIPMCILIVDPAHAIP